MPTGVLVPGQQTVNVNAGQMPTTLLASLADYDASPGGFCILGWLPAGGAAIQTKTLVVGTPVTFNIGGAAGMLGHNCASANIHLAW